MARRSAALSCWLCGLSAAALAQTPAPPPAAPLASGAAAPATAITPPVALSTPDAEWPPGRAQPADLIVPVLLTLDAEGRVEHAELESSPGEPFEAAALAVARSFRFSPARDASGPHRARIRSLVRFRGVSPPVPSEPPVAAPSGVAPVAAAPASVTTVTVEAAALPHSASDAHLDRPLLEAAPHRNASEMLMVVPGVFVSQHSGEGKAHQIFLRGFDAVHGQDIEIWAAGAPVNEVSNIHGQGYADLHFLIPEVVSEIHSTPGVYDPSQGDFAVAGTLRLRLGYGEPGTTARASFGSYGRRRLFLAYHPEGKTEETFGALQLESTDGFGAARAARNGAAIVQARFELGAIGARIMASTYAGRFDSPGVLRLEDIEQGVVGRFDTYDEQQGGYSSRTQLVLELGEKLASSAGPVEPDSWSVSPFLVLRTLKLRSNFTGYLTSPEGDSIQQLNETLTLGAIARYRRRLSLLSDGDRLEAGSVLRSDSIRQSQHRLSLLTGRVTDDADSPGIDANVRATNAAGYLDVDLHPLPRVSVRGGLRADALSYMTEDRGGDAQGQARSALGARLSKRGSVDVGVLPGLHALLSYGEGYRSPQARSLGDGETTPFTRVVSYELGLRYRMDEWLSSSLAGFVTELSDDLVFDPTTARNELVPSTRRIGVALDASARPVSALVAHASLTYARAAFTADGGQYRRGDLLPYVPQFVARADVAFSPVVGQVLERALTAHVGAGLTGLARRPLPYGELGHDIFLIDARAGLRWGPIETHLDLYNLFDADWYDGEFVYASQFGDAASLVPVRHVTVGPPFTLLWTLTLFV
jgi:TonB family protein